MPTALSCLLVAWLAGCDPALEPYRPIIPLIPPSHVQLVRLVELWDRDYGRAEIDEGRMLLPRAFHRRAGKILVHELGHFVGASTRGLDDLWSSQFWPRTGDLAQPTGQTTQYVLEVLAEDGWKQAVDEDIAESYASLFADGVRVDQTRQLTLCQAVPDLRGVERCQHLLYGPRSPDGVSEPPDW